MGDTLSAFVQFISDDPIMLGLCIAIIILIIAFILVLLLGGKKETSNDEKQDNTQKLLKTEVNLDTLKSTQEYNLSEIQNNSAVDNLTVAEEPVVEEPPIPKVGASPVNPVLKSSEPDVAMEIPVASNTPVSLEIPVIDTPQASSLSSIQPEPVLPASPKPIMDNNIDASTIRSDYKESVPPLEYPKPIIESKVSPLDKTTKLETNNPSEVELPIITGPVPLVDTKEQYSSINTEEFSRSTIIRHLPVEETKETSDTNLDDIDLPKLNTSSINNNAFSTLEKETFNIK